MLGASRTVAVVNADLAPTAQFVRDTDTRYDRAGMMASLAAACREVAAMPAATRVVAEMGDAIYLNVFLLGVAYQRGLVPLSAAAIGKAIAMNGAAVARNQEAFARGRAAAADTIPAPAAVAPEAEALEALIARRVADLTAYQNARYARRYAEFVTRVRTAEGARLGIGEERLARAVAIQLHRLMAYKDEYEVARLHADPAWQAQLARGFTGTQRIELHLAPPLLAKRDPDTGLPRKMVFGPWMLRAMGWLRHGKALRGTALDPFGRTEERRTERALIEEYRAGIERLLRRLTPATHATICDWAEAAAGIRGFGHVKAATIGKARERMAAIEASLDAPAPAKQLVAAE